jgi:hypothetical protein
MRGAPAPSRFCVTGDPEAFARAAVLLQQLSAPAPPEAQP